MDWHIEMRKIRILGIGGNGGQFCGKGLGEGGKITVGYRLQNKGPAEGEVLL